MARFVVNAFSDDFAEIPANREPNYVLVSVTDTGGVPVTGLSSSDFKADPMIVGPGGAPVSIAGVTGGRLPGFYHIKIVPARPQDWKKGCYIFAVAVERGADQGQALATCMME